MKHNPGKISLYISTSCILLINFSHIFDCLKTGDPGSIVSNVCFVLGDICLVIAWIAHFLDKKKQA